MSALAAPPGVLGADELVGFAASLAATPAYRSHPRRSGGGRRGYRLIWSDANVNAWLIAWGADADTGFHDHDSSAAGIVVLEGIVLEDRLALHGPPITRRFRRGESFHLPTTAIHRVRHGGGRPALTIHAYSPPLRTQGVYRVAADGALEREAVPSSEELGEGRPRFGGEDAATVTYSALKRKYATNAPGARRYELPDAELRDDLRFAAQIRALGGHTRESAGGRTIERWIADELEERSERRRERALRGWRRVAVLDSCASEFAVTRQRREVRHSRSRAVCRRHRRGDRRCRDSRVCKGVPGAT